jgi:hypothetical protein
MGIITLALIVANIQNGSNVEPALWVRLARVKLAFLNTTLTIEYIIKPTQKAIIGDTINTSYMVSQVRHHMH